MSMELINLVSPSFLLLLSLAFNLTNVAGDIFIFVSGLYAGGVKFEQLV